MLKAIKIRLYPNNGQEIYMNKLLGSYRFVYNQSLNFAIQQYKEDKKSVNIKILGNFLFQNLLKNEELHFLNEHNTKVLNQTLINLLDSYKRFFINGNGFPKFKSKNNNQQSCRFPAQAISKNNDYESGRLTLTKQLKNLKFRCSKQYKKQLNESIVKSATLTKTKSNKYYLSILVETELNKQLPESNNIIGIDLGIKDFIITSEGETFDNIKIKRNNQKKIAKLHRKLSRKKKGSNNRNKAKIKLAKYYEKLNNKKEYYLHKISNKLLNENQVIVMESLSVSNMVKNHKLAKSLQELSLYRFKEILRYKSSWYGRDLVEIDRWFPSSKLCNNCGYKNNGLTLKDRTWICPECSKSHDRDINAAINIKKEGIKILTNKVPDSIGELTLQESSLLGSRRMKKNNFL
jgi:putative transposase